MSVGDQCRHLYALLDPETWLKIADPDIDTYTLRAVGQDDFDDVKVPDQPRKPSEAK